MTFSCTRNIFLSGVVRIYVRLLLYILSNIFQSFYRLSPNIYRTFEESLEAFKLFSKVKLFEYCFCEIPFFIFAVFLMQNGDWERIFPSWERAMVIYLGAVVMYFIGKRLKKRHGLLDDPRQSLYQEVSNFLDAVKKKGTSFIGGQEPNLADLAVYGCISSIDGMRNFPMLARRNLTVFNTFPW